MACQKCKSERVVQIQGKCDDRFFASYNSPSIKGPIECQHDGYVPNDMGIGGGDEVEFQYCLECGQIQGSFPLEETKLERGKLG